LADPYVLGVESGAAAAAVAVIFLSRRAVLSGEWSPTVAAFLGALATLALVFSIARKNGRVTSTRVLLVGVALSYALSGLTSFFLYASPDPAAQAQVLFWIMGGLGGASWTNLPIALGVLVAAWLAFGYYARQLNAMAMGDMSAVAVGLNPDRVRTRLLIISSLLVAVTVTLAGPIGFVGLVVPHVGRMLFGAEHRRLIPAVVLLGGIYLVLVDTLCRTIFAPSEIPIGVMTALLGTPFFLWLIRRKDSAMGGA
jgi:iron complex transport system permease protein